MKYKLSCFLSFYIMMVFFLSKAHAGFVYEVLFEPDQGESFQYYFIDKDDGVDLVVDKAGEKEERFHYKKVDEIAIVDDSVAVYKDEHSSPELAGNSGIQANDKVVFLTIDLERAFFSEKINCGTKENPVPPDSNEPRLLIMNKEGRFQQFQVWYKEFYQGVNQQVDSIDQAKLCVLFGNFLGSGNSNDAFNLTINLDVQQNEFFARLEENIPGEDGFQTVYELYINEEDEEDEEEDSLPATQKVDTEDQYSDESEEDKEGNGSDEDEGEDYLPATQKVKQEHHSPDENNEDKGGSDEEEDGEYGYEESGNRGHYDSGNSDDDSRSADYSQKSGSPGSVHSSVTHVSETPKEQSPSGSQAESGENEPSMEDGTTEYTGEPSVKKRKTDLDPPNE